MKNYKVIIAVLVAAGLLGWMVLRLYSNKQEIDTRATAALEVVETVVPVRTAVAAQQDVSNELTFQGAFEARKQLDIVAEAAGRLTSLRLEEGDRVGKGQAVAKIDDTSLRAQLAAAQASYDKMSKDVERFQRLREAGAVSQLQLEEVQLGLENSRTQVTGIQQQLKYTNVKSPMTGTVSTVMLEEGGFVSPGSKIATVVDISQLKMVVKVPENEVVKLRTGQPVEVRPDVYPDAVFNGRITNIAVQADAGRKYEVEIELPNPRDTPLRAGMYGSVSLKPTDSGAATALVIPRKALVGSLKDARVYVVLPNQTVELRPVQIGRTLEDQLEVTGGLAAGEKVVTTGQINLETGKKVRVLGEEAGAGAAVTALPAENE